jgi:DNA-binding transcriptional MerR regulator
MNGYRIAEAARQTGFSESALRFYEREGVVIPERTPTGYRSYTSDDIDALQFVARSKRLGLSLDEITELLTLLDRDKCRPVQERLGEILTARVAEAQNKIADLIAFTGQLQKAASWLGQHTPEGGCDDDCGCKSDLRTVAIGKSARCDDDCGCAAHSVETSIQLGATSDIACSLDAASVADRIADWQNVLDQAEARQPLARGVTIQFARAVDVEAIAALAAAEQTCCQFFSFGIRLAADAVYLDVTGPADARPVIESIFGVAS